MNHSTSNPLPRPLLIYDGDCGFCKQWISVWSEMTGESLEYATSQDILKNRPELVELVAKRLAPKSPQQAFEESVVHVTQDGAVQTGAKAVLRSLAPTTRWAHHLTAVYQTAAPIRWALEFGYARVAKNRRIFSWLTWLCWGDTVARSTYQKSTWIFLRSLAAIYLIAFVSLGSQIQGLAGSQGLVQPDMVPGFALEYLDIWVMLPQVLGGIFSTLLLFDMLPRTSLCLAWGLYWYSCQLAGEFLWFQWDALLLEMGFLSIFLVPFKRLDPAPYARFLLRWLLFRVLFFSGWVKLASGDPHWRDFTALVYHFETQPIPTWMGWYAHQLPAELKELGALLLFGVELGLPFLFFGPRRIRILAALCSVGFQLLINITGNYGFFGWQIVALGLLLMDDEFLSKIWRKPFPNSVSKPGSRPVQRPSFVLGWLAALCVVAMSLVRVPVLSDWAGAFRLVNHYGVFATMTTIRDEVVIEGSQDGKEWLEYEFKWKPGEVGRAPPVLLFYMPRLDWQLWFAALGDLDANPWVGTLLKRVLEGAPKALRVFDRNPFAKEPPLYVRATRYEYHFSDWETRTRTGRWWIRQRVGPYSPILTR